jgi:hypothetical protein
MVVSKHNLGKDATRTAEKESLFFERVYFTACDAGLTLRTGVPVRL